MSKPKLIRFIKICTDAFLSLVFPPRCIFCRKPLKHDGVCSECNNRLPYVKSGRAKSPTFIEKTYAPLFYRGYVRSAILRFKFRRATVCAPFFAEIIEDCMRGHIEKEVDFITWVPISKRRLKKRGYDQSKLLAEHISQAFNIPLLQTLRKSRNNAKQSKQSSEAARHANVIGVYSAVNQKIFFGKRLLIVDDVLTSGATLSECARTLRTAGAESVFAAVIAKTKKKN